MAIAASGQGGMLVRVDPEDHGRASSPSRARAPFEMRGPRMRGWLRVDSDDVETWVRRGVDHARGLPPK